MGQETITPAVGGRPWDTELVEGLPGRQVRLFNEPNDF